MRGNRLSRTCGSMCNPCAAASRSAKDVRAGELELLPKRMLRPALPFGNRCEHQQDSAVGKIGAGDDILDPLENDGAGGRKKNFVPLGEKTTCGKGAAPRPPAAGIRRPSADPAQ